MVEEKKQNEYRRNIFEKGFKEIKKILAEETGNYHIDIYTEKQLIPGGKWDYEHIISAKEFSTLDGVGALSDETQSEILNNRKNIGCTDRIINKSKDKYSLSEWAKRCSNRRKITNAEYYGINLDRAENIRNDVLNFIQNEIVKKTPIIKCT